MDKKYSWVNTHKGIVQYLSDKENSQQELIELLKSIGISPFNDKSKEGDHDIELSEIDPFTFFCYIHKYGEKKRLKLLQQIAEKLGLEVPKGESGIPSAQPQLVWLFSYKYLRVNNEVARLWNLFKKELKGEIDDEVFADVLDITNVAKTKLTEALFYINPEKYLPINGPTKPYIKDVLGMDYKFSTYSEYMELLDKIREKIDVPFYELSYEAWVWSNKKKKINYWVFQGNPDKYDFETAFRDGDISAWTVTSHKNKIKPGDKVIIWITGSEAGCYALAEVASEPLDRASFPESHLWKVDDTSELKAAINITHNLANNPILKEEIKEVEELANLKVGTQGTNFSATEKEYKALLELAMKKKDDKRYWLYSPGEQARNWDEFYNDGIMGLGWDKLENLNSYKNKNEIKKALDEAYGGDGSKKNVTTANDEFANVMQVGDVVIVKRGLTELLGYGVVTSDYIYDENRSEYKHLREIDWKLKGNWDVGFQMVTKTLTDITPFATEDPNYNTYAERLLGIMGVNNVSIDHRENFIKWLSEKHGDNSGTINSYVKAIDILSEILSKDIFKSSDVKYFEELYKDLIKEQRNEKGRYYHPDAPSYGNNGFYSASIKAYMEFLKSKKGKSVRQSKEQHSNPTNTILYGPPGTGKTYNTINEALKIIDNKFLEENSDDRATLNKLFRKLRFNPETEEGQIAFITFHQSLSYEDFIEGIKPVKSENNEDVKYEVCDGIFKSIAKVASKKKVDLSFDENYEEFINYVMEQGSISLETPVQKKPFDVRVNGSGNCVAIPQTEIATEMVINKKMIEVYLQDGTVNEWKPYLLSIANYIRTNYHYEAKEIDNTTKPYVIIIDEINRGNISQIFGELITLIEPDKRKGQAEEIEVILPYSKERFSVPSNLHIIGTMNTADRSVEALDTALRRRFSFMEMNPAPWLLNSEEFRCEGIDLNVMLEAINGRIEKLLDKDYCIGHSYFMTIKNKREPLDELKYIFQNKILPLLQEYFYGDWGKIRLIVGKEFVEMKKSDVDFLDLDSVEDYEEFDERPIYNFTNSDGWSLESFKLVYEETK